ncbi:hypothetical protein DCMF_21850 [Candidatus Formimonas warabiya]|uniref:MoaD/ThiS family protein n=2 Tax=Formimonas warabiya TaxID=1761012 RepID=A0A3G1KX79_FORW1|nr:hypothetical protein DCMF_21850 [Candidatus Formimonas warabiya]
MAVVNLITGKNSEVLEIEDNTSIEKLVEELCTRYGHRFKDIVCINARNRKYLVDFWINKVSVSPGYLLKDGDELTILLALGGG